MPLAYDLEDAKVGVPELALLFNAPKWVTNMLRSFAYTQEEEELAVTIFYMFK